MPPIDVVVHSSAGFLTTWGPLIVAVGALIGVIYSSNRHTKAVLGAEDKRAANEDRRYVRGLIADVAGAAKERTTVVMTAKVLDVFRQAHESRETRRGTEDAAGVASARVPNVAEYAKRVEETAAVLERSVVLVQLTTKIRAIHLALAEVQQADAVLVDALRKDIATEVDWTAAGQAGMALSDAVDRLVTTASEHLATTPTR